VLDQKFDEQAVIMWSVVGAFIIYFFLTSLSTFVVHCLNKYIPQVEVQIVDKDTDTEHP
jgi:hypothetical protein